MAMNGNFTLFTNDSGGGASANEYIKDAFDDFSLPATNNSGLTSSASTNPLGKFFGDDDATRFSVKTLWVKDLVRIENKSKWINNKPTWKVIWNESFPAMIGYVFGDFFLSAAGDYGERTVDFKQIGDGFGVSGKIRRVAFICQVKDFTATAQFALDGTNTGTVTLNTFPSSMFEPGEDKQYRQFVYTPQASGSSNETNDLHDYRVTALQAATASFPQNCALSVAGVQIYYENANASIEVSPGTTYVNKSKNTTTVGASFPVPTYGSSLGGISRVVKGETSGYTLVSQSFSGPVSIAQGLSGTNLMTVSTGHGASFPVGSGVALHQGGGSYYLGTVQSVSTDTLTMSPTLPFGISNAMYRAWSANATASINASMFVPFQTIDFSKYYSVTQMPGAADGRWIAYGIDSLFTLSTIDGTKALGIGATTGSALQIDGRFSAADIEFISAGALLHVTMSINGCPVWGQNAGLTGVIKRTVFSDAGSGWNSFVLSAGASNGAVGIKSVTLYERTCSGVSYGSLSEIPTQNAFLNRGTINASVMALGTYQRVYANWLDLKGFWTRANGGSFPGGYAAIGASTNAVVALTYYGKNVAVVGTPGGGTLSIDGVGVGLSFGFMHTVASEGWHTVQYTSGTGATSIISAIDYTRANGEVKSLQKIEKEDEELIASGQSILDPSVKGCVWVTTENGYGSGASKIRIFSNVVRYTGTSITRYTSAAAGDCFKINKSGVYSISYVESFNTDGAFGVSLNSEETTTAIESISLSGRLIVARTSAANKSACASVSAYLYAGDVLRPHTNGDAGAQDEAMFIITEIG